MKRVLFSLLFSMIACFAAAQSGSGAFPLSSLSKIDLGPGGVGLSREMKLGNKMTTLIGAGMGGGYSIAEGSVAITWSILSPAFYFIASPRYYYNRDKRAMKEKSTRFNTGNYFGIGVKYVTGNIGGAPPCWSMVIGDCNATWVKNGSLIHMWVPVMPGTSIAALERSIPRWN
jgi:hypothetical protein